MQPVLNHGRWVPAKRPRALAPHRDAGLELIYVIRGDVTWDYAGVAVPAPAHSITYTWPWQEHGSATPTVPPTELIWLTFPLDLTYRRPPRRFALHPALGFDAAESAAILTALQRGYGAAVPAPPLLRHLIPALEREVACTGPLKRACVLSLARLVLVELARAVEHPLAAAPLPDARLRVARFLADLGSRCAEPWSLESMAAACGLGRTQFARLAAERAGDSPSRLLNRLRVARAVQLLCETDRPVTEIALDCGFSSSQYFAGVFRAFRHQSPSACRRRSPGV